MDQDILTYRQRVEAAVDFLRERITEPPEIVVVLGTGLGSLVEQMESPEIFPYEDLPGFPRSTVTGHAGNLVCGLLAGRPTAVLQGRFHYYEGYSAREVALPVRVLSLLGAGTLVVTNAAGGLDPDLRPGSLMVIRDHLNLIPDNPLRGPNIDEWGLRFPDLSNAYDQDLIRMALRAGGELGIEGLTSGVYGAIPGPSLETPAETRHLRNCGIDAVGMSTVPEVIVARHASMRVLGISVIANVNDPDNFQPITLEDVIEQTNKAADQLTSLIMKVVPEI
jgi:purine-nucleoside phosphorylase